MVDKWVKTIIAVLALLFALSVGSPIVRAENKWGVGTDIGFLSDTTDDTVFTLSFQGDYFLNSQVSVGPQLLFSPGGDLTQVTLAGIGRYYIPIGAVTVIPFGGIGFVYADLEQGRRDDSDVSYSFPFGATAAFKINRTVDLSSTLILTFQDIELNNRKSSDNFNIGMLFGFRFQP